MYFAFFYRLAFSAFLLTRKVQEGFQGQGKERDDKRRIICSLEQHQLEIKKTENEMLIRETFKKNLSFFLDWKKCNRVVGAILPHEIAF